MKKKTKSNQKLVENNIFDDTEDIIDNEHEFVDENLINENRKIIGDTETLQKVIDVKKLFRKIDWIKKNTQYITNEKLINKFNETYNEKLSKSAVSCVNTEVKKDNIRKAQYVFDEKINPKRQQLLNKFVNSIYYKRKLKIKSFVQQKIEQFRIEIIETAKEMLDDFEKELQL